MCRYLCVCVFGCSSPIPVDSASPVATLFSVSLRNQSSSNTASRTALYKNHPSLCQPTGFFHLPTRYIMNLVPVVHDSVNISVTKSSVYDDENQLLSYVTT